MSLNTSNSNYFQQMTPKKLVEITIKKGQGQLTNSGSLAINTGKFTGRSPKDRFIVEEDITKGVLNWGEINISISSENYRKLKDDILKYLEGKEIYTRFANAGALKKYQLRLEVITEYAWSNLFAYNMFIRPEEKELENFRKDWTIIDAPGFMADPGVHGTRQSNFAILSFSEKTVLIGGTGYTGEIKKGIFSALNFILPTEHDVLPMHCSANVGKNKDTAIFFGLSGTGKTTLSADPNRKLVGDDEHGWTPEGQIFNFEGGCYAKVIDLDKKSEPDIYNAIHVGALLENVIIKNGEVDFKDISITQNTRVSYPINHIDNIQVPSVGENPENIFFLTADAFGVLPPVSKLTKNQAAYHFISGYTSKIAGTEAGINEPVPSFSACFGEPFMPLHPTIYAEMLSEKIERSDANVWLINTGWTGGAYGVGSRIKLEYTRAMVNAILDGKLDKTYSYEKYHIHSVFGVAQPRSCPGVPDKVLSPRATWDNDEAYYTAAFKLSNAFRINFAKFESYANEEIRRGGPQRFDF
ncbi:phosphoenolpyruvate carboxykinase (ATP) [Zunongwangia endophytica]|uniref:Phosphoenolpyruvate carboxykinase (ATP) n=1 Tax=Zunongwangia endophytica TaxID=1808945 RepID=A0ABV8H331_9FLAO|nr:phosphoenolpyruvate carboxykinase (ATP) [Zunongwangia endophytica]MDN3595963.1 phosphoenolpyruvate carboxykinase (ATP) [Zunongwangia endophytica]